MGTTVYKYRVWCDTDSKYVEVWGEAAPTVCPENDAHSIDPVKTAIIDSVTQDFPISDLDGKKLSVHESTKPAIDGAATYSVWTGAGDDPQTGAIGEGETLAFAMSQGVASVSKDVTFDPSHGRVWIHEGYLRYNGAGAGDYVSADVVASATNLQQLANLDLIVEDNWIKPAPGGAGTGTDGWADANLALIPRTFSKDGDWDYDGVSVTPNLAGNGGYKISDIERIVHRFINRIPCLGDCPTYFSMSSEETTELPGSYHLRITFHNVSDSNWTASVLIEIYRQRTHVP